MSSEIENIVTTQDALFRSFAGEPAQAIRALLDATTERCRAELPTRVYSKELVELICIQPYIRIQTLVDVGLAIRETASGYLRGLERIGVLQREKDGREVFYRHPALLEVLIA